MKLSEVIRRCEAFLPRSVEYEEGEAYGAHGITDFDKDVKKILYCVTPSPKVRKYFKENGYDLLISHHPFEAGVPQLIYHTALDCCEGGLNDMWADAVGIDRKTRKHFDKDLGWAGELTIPCMFDDLIRRVSAFTDISGQIYCEGYSKIKTVVVCSGLGGMVDNLALESGADCYILGEAIRPATGMGFKAVIETGHTNSEWMGVNFFRHLLRRSGVVVDGTPLDIDVYGTEFYRNELESDCSGEEDYCCDLHEYGV